MLISEQSQSTKCFRKKKPLRTGEIENIEYQ